MFTYTLPALATLLVGSSLARSAPVGRAIPAGITDTVILQYALTLEHLENVFYTEALNKFDADAFMAAGFPDWVRARFEQISDDEASHVAFLTTAIGAGATEACNYTFPYTDPVSFTALAAVIENVGVSAYLGAAADITTPAYVTSAGSNYIAWDGVANCISSAAGSILTTEARHQAWISAAVDKQNPWSSPYDTPLAFGGVCSLVTPFITSCPSSNPALPFKAFPVLASSTATPGSTTQLTYADTTSTEKYLIVYYGLSTVAMPINEDKTVMLPSDIMGTAYAVVSTSSNTTHVDPITIVAGPVILLNPFPSAAMNPSPASAGQ